jgi:predicted deacylase
LKILIISGVHGNEVSAVEVGMRLAEQYNNRSEIEVIPWANVSGLIAGTREMQYSSTKDLNRSFVLQEENYIEVLMKAIDKADFVIDIHNSPRCGHFALLDVNSHEQHLSNLCKHAGIEYGSRYSNGGTIKDYVNSQFGKSALTYEFPGMGTYNNKDNISRAFDEISELVDVLLEDSWSKHYRDNHAGTQRLKELFEVEGGYVEVLKDVNEIVQPNELIYNIRNQQNEIISSGYNNESCPIKILTIVGTVVKKGSMIGMYIKL